MEKLATFAAKKDETGDKTEEEKELETVKKNIDIFKLFKKYTDKIILE